MTELEEIMRTGYKLRRYFLGTGRTVRTVEVPFSVIKAFGTKRLREQFEAWKRGELQRQRQERIQAMLLRGLTPQQIAPQVGVTEQRVRQIRKALRHEAVDP